MHKEKELLWRISKYEVMAHSEKAYRNIQRSFPTLSLIELQQLIEQALEIPPTTGSITNAYQHMWGYFKKKATTDEKEKTFYLLSCLQQSEVNETVLWNWIATLSVKYEQDYLINSSLIARIMAQK